MTSTAVKDVSSFMATPSMVQNGKNAGSTGEFQRVWNNQMNSNTMGSYVPNSSAQESKAAENTTVKTSNGTETGETVSPKEETVQGDRKEVAASSEQSKDTGEVTESKEELAPSEDVSSDEAEVLSPEDLQQAMEVLGTAALNLMQQIADAFGISLEELQATMDELGMGQMDLLDVDALSGLLLKLGGAEDSYALLMDEDLYGKYRSIMEQFQGIKEECADALGMDSEQVEALVQKISVGEELTEEAPETVTPFEGKETEQTTVSKEAATEVMVDVAKESQGIGDKDTQEQSGQTREEGRHASEKFDGEQYHQVFDQNLNTGEFRSQAMQAESILQNSGWSADTRNIMNQIMDYMKVQFQVDATSMELQLHPASLGTLRVQIDSNAGVLTAHFITQNESVKAALESQIVQLQDSFEAQGVKVEAIEVTVQTHEFEQNLEQGRGRNQQEPEKKNRTRRINLNDPLTMDTVEEEDALAADIMAASGSTVDYTA